MPKSYICQLSGGRMLVFQDGWVGVETTGYPLPDCTLVVGGRTLRGQQDVMRAILGYDVEDWQAFSSAVADIQPMVFDSFKYKVLLENIGGGCPKRVREVFIAEHDMGLSKNQALFKYLLPRSCVDELCQLPSEHDLIDEYADMLRINWATHQNIPNWKFRNNILMFTGCREVTDKHIAFIRDVVQICMKESEKAKYRYISGITLSNGNGAIVLIDSYIGHWDVAYLYQKVTSVDLSVGQIEGSVEQDGSVSMHFVCADKAVKRRKWPELKGVVKRQQL